jgi:Zn-dependent M28 family amino/carboxypeptidase
MIPYLHQHRPALAPLTAAHLALAQQLRRDVEILATDIGPRGTFAPDRYALAASVLQSSLTNAGYAVTRHSTISLDVEAFNLEVTLRGTSTPDRVLIVGAHYDSMPRCPAANDNASGVAAVLAIARALRDSPQPCTIRFVLFANEEPPHFNLDSMGSQDYARDCRRRGDDIRGMVCLETIGCYKHEPNSQSWPMKGLGFVLPTVGDFITFVGPDSSKRLIKAAAAAFEAQSAFPLLAAAAPKAIDQINWSDHRGFNEVGYEAFMVTDTAPLRYEHYHAPTDTPEKLDYESMARVVSGLTGMMRTLAHAE